MPDAACLWGPRLYRAALIEKIRTLPLGSEVLVETGQAVEAGTVVGHLNPEGYLHFVNVAQELDVPYHLAEGCLVKQEGDRVARGEVIAARPAALGLLLAECRSPADGVIEKIYPSGHLTVRGHPIPVEAFVAGRVVEVVPGERIAVMAAGTLIQGVWGQGGERRGRLVPLTPGAKPSPRAELAGAVVATPEPLGPALLRAAAAAGAAALIGPSAHHTDLPEDGAVAVILTEGFGRIPMSRAIWETLAGAAGAETSVSGITQLRAGVERPEIVIARGPVPDGRPAMPAGLHPLRLGRHTFVYAPGASGGRRLGPGVRVRCVRAPHAGLEGTVVDLPAAPQPLASGVVLPVAIVALSDGRRLTTPRANLEVVELGAGSGMEPGKEPGMEPGKEPGKEVPAP